MTGARARARAGEATWLAAAAALAALVLAAAWIGQVVAGRAALARADAALARGDRLGAILAARAAAEARCPWCSAPAEGYAQLERIAASAEARDDDETAFAAWRNARAAALGTLGRGDERRARAERELARLGHRIDLAQVSAGGAPSEAAQEARLRAALARDEAPSSSTLGLVALGGALFLWGASRFARRGADVRAATLLRDVGLTGIGAALAAAGVALF